MKALKKLAVFCVGAALTVGSAFGFAACDNGTDPQGYDDPNIREVYSLYVASAEESGNEPMTYEEWLASIKGDKGDPGDPGQPGKDGSSFLHGEGAPKATDGKAGDLYLDVLTGDLYEKDANGWSADPVGNLKGPKGDKGDSATGSETEPVDDAVKTWDNVTIESNGTYTLDCKDVTPGLYWLVAETDATADFGILTVNASTPTDSTSNTVTKTQQYDLYSSTTKSFKGLLLVDATIASIDQPVITSTSATSMNVNFKLVEYKPISIKAGEEIEIPAALGSSNSNAIPTLLLDDTLVGKSVNITISSYDSLKITMAMLCGRTSGTKGFTNNIDGRVNTKSGDTLTATITVPAGDEFTFLIARNDQKRFGTNFVVKIELAS